MAEKKIELLVFGRDGWTQKTYEFFHGLRILKSQEKKIRRKKNFKLTEDSKYEFLNGALVNKPKPKKDDPNRTTSEEVNQEPSK